MILKHQEKSIYITNKLGLHARAAAKFVKITSKIESKVVVKKGDNTVNGSSILGLMTLAATKGSQITIRCSGKNPDEDLNQLLDLVRKNFGEEKVSKTLVLKEKVHRGIGVSSGVAIGICSLREKIGFEFLKYNINKAEVDLETKRFNQAVKLSIKELQLLIKKKKTEDYLGQDEMKFILQAHVSILNSSSLVSDSRKKIEKNLINAEAAITEELQKYASIFKKIKNQYLKARFEDVKDVCTRLLNNLQKSKRKVKVKQLSSSEIIVSEDLSAADFLALQNTKIGGLVSQYGGPEGHFAIVARSFSIPTVVGVKAVLKNFRDGEKIIIDGENGLIIQNPSFSSIQKYKNKIDEQRSENLKLNSFKGKKPFTKDNKRLFVEANVDNPDDIKNAISKGIDGIGLFRSEYLYMNRKTLPSEEEQFRFIKNSLEVLNGRTLTIRTLDIGNDKHIESIDKLVAPSPNPALGLRAIRLTLAFPKIFEKQISAILRASNFGPIRMMLPMVSNVNELEEAKKIINKVRKNLIKNKVKIPDKDPPIGILIETPAAALTADSLAEKCDFLAIGTNDLTMYTLAMDRGDESVAKIYDPAHLSVIKLIKMTYDSGKRMNIPVSICGEMAGDTFFTALLIGIGINVLSMSTSRVLKVKQFINFISYKEAKKLSDEILKEKNNEKIKKLLRKFKENLLN